MTFFIVLGMIIMFLVGLGLICGSLGGLFLSSAFGGLSFGDYIGACIMFCLGLCAWYFVFSHVSIGIG